MNLRSRQLFTDPIEVMDDTDDEGGDTDFGDGVITTTSFVDGLDTGPVPEKKTRKSRVAKRTLSHITDLLDAYICPPDSYVPSDTELLNLLHNLYDSQTHLITSYNDLPAILALLPMLRCSFLLITVDQPQMLDFNQFIPHLFLNHVGAVRSPPLLDGRDDVLQNLNGVHAANNIFCIVLLLTLSFLMCRFSEFFLLLGISAMIPLPRTC